MWRYTDFLVNEIELNGQVLHLTNTAVPVQITANKKKAAEKQQSNEEEKEVSAEEAAASNGNGVKTEDEVAEGAENGDSSQKDPAEVCSCYPVDKIRLTLYRFLNKIRPILKSCSANHA